MKYGMIDTATLASHFVNGPAPSDVAMAIAMCMPSVSEGGHRNQRGTLVSGLQAAYHASALQWGAGDVTVGCRDIDFFNVTGHASNKTNHLKWLTQAGLITVTRTNGVRYSRLTDAGLAQVKLVAGNELAKLAKAFTLKAYEAAHKAFAKAQQPDKPKRASKPRKATVEAVTEAVEPVAGEPVEGITTAVVGNASPNVLY